MARDKEQQCVALHGMSSEAYNKAYNRGFRNGLTSRSYVLCEACNHFDPDPQCTKCQGRGFHHKMLR